MIFSVACCSVYLHSTTRTSDCVKNDACISPDVRFCFVTDHYHLILSQFPSLKLPKAKLPKGTKIKVTQRYQIKGTKSNLPEDTKSNLPKDTKSTKDTKSNLPQRYQI